MIFLIPFFFFSCRTGNILIRKERKEGQIRNITDAKLIKNTEQNYLDFNTLFFKRFLATVTINGESRNFKGNLFIRKDSSIIISIFPLMGIEIFRIKYIP